MNRGSLRRPGRVWTVALGVVLTAVDLALSAVLWAMAIALVPTPGEWVALVAFASISCVVFAWPSRGLSRRGRLLGFWCLPIELLRGLAVGWGRGLAGWPFLELVWRARFIVGIAALAQNWLEGTPLLGLIPAGIIAVSYLWPWLRRVHARRSEAAMPPGVPRVRAGLSTGTASLPSGEAEPLKGVLQ